MGMTARFKLRFISKGESMNGTRLVLEDNANTIDKALTDVQAFAAQLASLMQGGPGRTQTFIGKDTDGVPYFDPTNSVAQPLQVGLDVDATPYVIDWTVT